MNSATRVCYSSGGTEITVAPDGTLRVQGVGIEVHRIYAELLHVPNVTHVYSSESVDECFQRMEENRTDFIFTRRPLPSGNSAIYYIPVPTLEYVNQIITGYNYSKYRERVENEEDSVTRLFLNFNIYDKSTVLLLLIYLAALYIILRLTHRLGLNRNRSSRRVSWRKCEGPVCNRKSDTWKLVEFILNLCFFFLAAPFLAKFSTNQVVTSPPDLITTYEQILERRVQIVVSSELLDDFNLKPSAESLRNNDTQAQIYLHRKKNSITYSIPRSLETLASMQKVADLINDGKAVMFSPNRIIDAFRDAFCSWTDESSLAQVFIVTDPSSTEFLTGMPFRKGFTDTFLQRKLRRIFEVRLMRAILKNSRQYAGFKYKREITTSEHRFEQLSLCSLDHLVRMQKETRSPGLKSFSLFLIIYLTWLLLQLIIHTIDFTFHRNSRQYHKKLCSNLIL